MTTVQHPAENLAWYALSPEAAAGQMGVDPDRGLDAHEAGRRLEEYGPNELPADRKRRADGKAGRPGQRLTMLPGRGSGRGGRGLRGGGC